MVEGEYVPADNIFSAVYFEMWTDNANDLAIGEYTYSNDASAGTYTGGEVSVNNNYEEGTEGDYYFINSGTVEILENEFGTYEIVFNCMSVNGVEVSGSFDGTLFTEDVSGRNSTEKSPKRILLTKKK